MVFRDWQVFRLATIHFFPFVWPACENAFQFSPFLKYRGCCYNEIIKHPDSTTTLPTLRFERPLPLQSLFTGFEEVYPLWALSIVSVGGLGWSTVEIGKVEQNVMHS